uniref:Uncharacterized protein n=1 Tax=Arundo donax TaxID=35708 RepID=A0A0A8YAL5_ARUDO
MASFPYTYCFSLQRLILFTVGIGSHCCSTFF